MERIHGHREFSGYYFVIGFMVYAYGHSSSGGPSATSQLTLNLKRIVSKMTVRVGSTRAQTFRMT